VERKKSGKDLIEVKRVGRGLEAAVKEKET
jgi:hypothetical protein